MALAYNVRRRLNAGDLSIRMVDVTLDAAYAAGGYTLTPKDMGFGTNGTILLVLSGLADGFLTEWDEAASKLKIRDYSTAADAAAREVTNALAGLNGVVVRCIAFGIGHG